jgi:hypothetical protein
MDASSGIGGRGDTQSPTERAGRAAAKRFGAISRRELLADSHSPTQIRGWLRRGLLHRIYPGVYAWGRRDLSEAGRLAAALLYAGPGAALTSLTALWWRGLLGRRPGHIQIDAPGYVRSHADIRIRHPRAITRESHRGLPVVPLPQSLLAASAHLSPNALRLALARADFHDQLDLAALHTALGPGRPGSTAVHRALAAHLPQLAACANRFERDFVELDGKDAHSSPAQLAADGQRQVALEALGYTVIRLDWEQLQSRPEAVAAELRRLLTA